MYSILSQVGNTTNYKYITYVDSETQQELVWNGTLEETQEKLVELMQSTALGKLIVVHNTNLTAQFTIEDVWINS